MESFDADREVAELKALKKKIRKRTFARSRLDKHHTKLLLLRDKGASAADLQRWLRQKGTVVVLTTVTRWLEKHGSVS